MTEARKREHRQERIETIKFLAVAAITVLAVVFLVGSFYYALEMGAWS